MYSALTVKIMKSHCEAYKNITLYTSFMIQFEYSHTVVFSVCSSGTCFMSWWYNDAKIWGSIFSTAALQTFQMWRLHKKSHATVSSCQEHSRQLNHSDNVKYREIILVRHEPMTVCYQMNNTGVQSISLLREDPFLLLEAMWVAWDMSAAPPVKPGHKGPLKDI